MNDAIKMQLSAFVDGELPDNEADLLVRRLSQDAELRQQVAEFLAIGRAMRGEYSIAGSETLRKRIAAAIDEKPMQDVEDAPQAVPPSRNLRFLGGAAVAATVALVAILGLQQTSVEDDGATTVAGEGGTTYTEPQADELVEYHRLHKSTAAPFEALELDLRTVDIQLEEEVVVVEPADEEADDESETDPPE